MTDFKMEEPGFSYKNWIEHTADRVLW